MKDTHTEISVQEQEHTTENDGIDRRNFLECMAWAGTGLLWSMAGGIPTSRLLAQGIKHAGASIGKAEDFSFVQISDCHIGFNKGANPDVTGTLQKAIDRANLAPAGMLPPDFMLHTGDITQNSKAAEFDTASQIIKGFRRKCSMSRASMISSMTGISTSSDLEKAPLETVGTVSTTKVSTS